MKHLFLPLLFLTWGLVPAASAQTQNGQSSYGGFLYGGQQEEEKPPAVWQYSKRYKKDFTEKTNSLLSSSEQYLYFVRPPGIPANQAVLRLASPLSIHGCVDIIPPKVTMRTNGPVMNIKIQSGDLALDKSVRYAHYQCPQGSNNASADIVLNRDELMRENIKTLTFQTEGGAMDSYNLELSGNRLTLIPKTSYIFKPLANSTKTDPLSYTFYPDNTLILYAPGTPKNMDISDQIIGLAQSKGMVESAGGLKTGSSGYFIDQPGTLTTSLAPEANAFVGNVTVEQTFQGPSGPYIQSNEIPVYARRPGFLD